MNPSLQEQQAAEVIRLSYECSTLEDFGGEVLPVLNRLFDASASLLYRCTEAGQVVALAGSLAEIHDEYMRHYFPEDVVQAALRRLNPWALHFSRLPEWKAFRRMPFFNELLHPREADHFYYFRLSTSNHKQAGDVGVMVARSERLPDFGPQENLLVMRVFPALEALVRRSFRTEGHLRRTLVERICEMDREPKVALDRFGRLLWATDSGASLLGLRNRRKHAVPEALSGGARRLAILQKDTPSRVPPATVWLRRPNGAPLKAELSFVRTHSEDFFILAQLQEPEVPPDLSRTATSHGLTGAETQVLNLLAQGRSDQEIARLLFVSIATVRTHVGRIFEKLAVKSRVQAALLAHGHPLPPPSRT